MSLARPDIPDDGGPLPAAPAQPITRSMPQKALSLMIEQHDALVEFLEKFPEVDFDLPEDNGEIALHKAVCYAADTLEIALNRTKNINHQEYILGYTPLHKAVSAAAPTSVQKLIARGADLTVKDRRGQTPLDLAISLQDEEMQEILKKAMPEEPPAAALPSMALSMQGRFKMRMKR